MRITPELITKVDDDEIFVFGSNQSGIHGKGAAHDALAFGAVWGQPSGIQGRTYGIPTKNASITKTLPLSKIAGYVTKFVEFAKEHPELTFYVTEIGCGLAGLTPKEVAPLFRGCDELENVYLPRRFWRHLS